MNIGKTKVVPEDDEPRCSPTTPSPPGCSPRYADYLVVNVSSPNTPGLRSLQAVDRLGPLLEAVRRVADVPLLVKIAPDLADDDVVDVARLALDLRPRRGHRHQHHRSAATASAPRPRRSRRSAPAGSPARRSPSGRCEVLRLLHKTVGHDLTLVSVGGISTGEDARARLEAGATLVQAYTGFVYGGPWWPRRIAQALAHGGVTS